MRNADQFGDQFGDSEQILGVQNLLTVPELIPELIRIPNSCHAVLDNLSLKMSESLVTLPAPITTTASPG